MTKSIFFIFILFSATVVACGQCVQSEVVNSNSQPSFVNSITNSDEFYELTTAQNRELWFTELETAKETPFTGLWDSYHENNYRISQSDFIKNYSDSKEIALAFQLGPNILNMSSYDIFIVRPVSDCYLFIRTYVSHDRINGKTYSIIDDKIFQELKKQLINIANEVPILNEVLDERKDKNTLFLVNNHDSKTYWLNVFNEYSEPDEDGFIPLNDPNPKIDELFNFLNSVMNWKESY